MTKVSTEPPYSKVYFADSYPDTIVGVYEHEPYTPLRFI